MKYVVAIIGLLCVAQIQKVAAQTAGSNANSISLIGETNTMSAGNGTANVGTVGLQYRKKGKKALSYLFTAGMTNYSRTSNQLLVIGEDTAIGRRTSDNIKLGVLGFGIEAQRQFYKRLYFFGGLDIRVGFGGGTVDSAATVLYNVVPSGSGIPGETIVTNVLGATHDAESMFMLGVTPYFGLKLQFARLELGTAFLNYVTHTQINQKGGYSFGSTDFEASNITQRIFISYRL